MRAEGKGEEYVISVPAYSCKDKLNQVVEDEMLIRNCNFVHSMELICLLLVICSSPVTYTLSLYVYIHKEFIILSCYLNRGLT